MSKRKKWRRPMKCECAETTHNDSMRECPYCGYESRVECEDYGEERHEEECSECGKKFWAWEEMTVTHIATPDCELNGEAHEWVDCSTITGPYPFCRKCDKCRPSNEVTP